MKKAKRPLTLTRRTIQELTPEALRVAAGGGAYGHCPTAYSRIYETCSTQTDTGCRPITVEPM